MLPVNAKQQLTPAQLSRPNSWRFYLAPLCTLVLLSCRAAQVFSSPIPPDSFWQTAAPQASALARYEAAARYSAEAHGLAVLVVRGRNLVFEEYQNNHTAKTPSHIYSGTKTFAGVLALAAVADGKFSLDERVSDTITEFRKDPLKRTITVRQLLQFTSGLEQDFWRLTRDGLLPPKHQSITDRYRYALTLPARDQPGTVYTYGSVHLMVFGEFIKRKLGENPLAYLERRVFAPIGFRYAGWNKDRAGNPALPYGAWTTAREWAKFGLLLRDQGKFGDQTVVPEEIMRELTIGSAAMPAYGLSVWLNRPVPKNVRGSLIPQLRAVAKDGAVLRPQGPDDLFAPAGHNGNRMYIIPSRDLIIVRLGSRERGYSDRKFLDLMLGP